MFDVAIIGGGTAGLTAGVYVTRAGKSAMLFERETFGGQISMTNRIENFPATFGMGGVEYAMKLYETAKNFGTQFTFGDVEKIEKCEDYFKVFTNSLVLEAKKIIIASGLKPRKLAVEGEEKFIGHGVSFCAVCDGMFYRDKTVTVVGGGETAIAYAEYLSTICKNVNLVHRRSKFRAQNAEARLEKLSNLQLFLNETIKSLSGEEKLKKIVLESGKTIQTDGLFVALGHIPDNERFKNLVDLDQNGYIIAGEDTKTKTNGVFVAGDCRTKAVRQLTTAAADGTVSATDAVNSLNI